jgi:hypothetical protein
MFTVAEVAGLPSVQLISEAGDFRQAFHRSKVVLS